MDLGNAIRSLRKSLKVSRKKLAADSGISITALYNIESNLSFPSKATIDNICSALGVPISFLLVFSITEDDVPENKREIFRCLSLPLKVFLLDDLIQK